MEFKIWVDADSCPAVVRKLILKNAQTHKVPVIFVANRPIPFDFESPLFTMVVCPKESGAADDYIFSNSSENDFAVTRDLPLAKRLLDKCLVVMNDRGVLFDQRNLKSMLEERELSMQMAALGIRTGGTDGGFGKKEIQKFADLFCGLLRKKTGNL